MLKISIISLSWALIFHMISLSIENTITKDTIYMKSKDYNNQSQATKDRLEKELHHAIFSTQLLNPLKYILTVASCLVALFS